MTGNPAAGEQVEGNLHGEVDFENRCFILSNRDHQPWIKVYWGPAIEGPKDNPTYTLKQIRRLKPGYYVAPLVVMEESESAGGLKEASLLDLPYKERPADFPKIPKQQGGGGSGRRYEPRNERAIVLQTCYKACAEVIQHIMSMPVEASERDEQEEFDHYMDMVLARAKRDADELCKHAGVK